MTSSCFLFVKLKFHHLHLAVFIYTADTATIIIMIIIKSLTFISVWWNSCCPFQWKLLYSCALCCLISYWLRGGYFCGLTCSMKMYWKNQQHYKLYNLHRLQKSHFLIWFLFTYFLTISQFAFYIVVDFFLTRTLFLWLFNAFSITY